MISAQHVCFGVKWSCNELKLLFTIAGCFLVNTSIINLSHYLLGRVRCFGTNHRQDPASQCPGNHEVTLMVAPPNTQSMSRERLSLEWLHNERHPVSNYLRLNCLLNCLFRRASQKTSKLRVTGLCEGNPPVTGGFPSDRSSNAFRQYQPKPAPTTSLAAVVSLSLDNSRVMSWYTHVELGTSELHGKTIITTNRWVSARKT